MGIKKVSIQNFTVFEDMKIDFASGVNVIIGENGTGKTHLMKSLYMLSLKEFQKNSYLDVFFDYFLIEPKEAIRNTAIKDYFKINFIYDNLNVEYKSFADGIINNYVKESNCSNNINDTTILNSLFIPSKDMLTHSKGFVSLYDERFISFDKSYKDIISKALLPTLKKIPAIGKSILPKLESIIDGKVIVDNDTFFIEKNNNKKINFSIEAEGIKKLAIIWQLIMNGSIVKNSILFWDEPEANINPTSYKDVAEILLELSRNGVQIFLASHNYNFAKYIEVLMKDSDDVAFHSLYKTDKGVKCETESKFSLLTNNALREDNINLYDAEMKKEFEE